MAVMWWMPSSFMAPPHLWHTRAPRALRCRSYAVVLARVRAAFLAAALRCADLRLRVAAAFLAAAWRFAGPPLARSSRSATSFCRSAIRAVVALPGPEALAVLSAWERSRATRLRRPLARRRSNRASAWDLAAAIEASAP